jgi:hypothetical protein
MNAAGKTITSRSSEAASPASAPRSRRPKPGAAVTLHESGRVLGGRTRTANGEWKANYGPHALYGDGPVVPWLHAKKLLPAIRRPPATGFRVRLDGRLQRAPFALIRAVLRLTSRAPRDVSFGEWASQRTRLRQRLPTTNHGPASPSGEPRISV